MFQLLEQNRLGSYDPILLGTLCNVDAVTVHPEYQRFMTLGMAAFVAPPGEAHKRFIDDQHSIEDKVLALSLFTLFAHENRHFWDSITTCSGLRRTRAALKLQQEFISSYPQFVSREALYFPFSEWTRNRTRLEGVSQALLTIPPEVEAFAARAERFLDEHQQWEQGGRDPKSSPTSTQIMEALAVIAQGEAIRRYFGDQAQTIFYNVVRAGETGRWYMGAIDYLRSRLPELDCDGQGLLLEMALYGSVELPVRDGSPAAILPYLVEQLEKTRPHFPKSFSELFVLCDGYLSLLQGVGPALSYRNAGRALFTLLNELGTAKPGSMDSTASALHDLFDCVASTVNIGARLVQKVLFAGNVGNLRITQQIDGLYHIPRCAPYFESSYGIYAGTPLTAVVQPLVGATVTPGWRSALEKESKGMFVELMRQLPDDESVDLLYVFAPRGEDVPDHISLSWKLFPQMFLCRMAIAGPSETHSLASALLADFLSDLGKPVYARQRCIAPLEDVAR